MRLTAHRLQLTAEDWIPSAAGGFSGQSFDNRARRSGTTQSRFANFACAASISHCLRTVRKCGFTF